VFSLKKKSATLALSTGIVLSVAACSEDDGVIDEDVTQDVGQDAEPVAEIDSLTGVSTAVELDQSFLDGLESLNLTPGTVGDATLRGSTLTFPITGGEVTYYDPDSDVEPFVQGEIEHEDSGLSLSSGGTTVELTDFVVDPGESVLTGTVSADGDVVAESAELFFLDGRTLQPLRLNEDEGTAVLEGTTVSLTQDAAELLNETFGTDALTEFFLVGEATITLELPGSGATTSPSPSPSPTASPSPSPSPTSTEVPATETSPEATPTETTVEESPEADATATPTS
jgi:hypothetical protein